MTMIITLIRPEGIWQTADNRVTVHGAKKDDATPKQLHIICPPGLDGPQLLVAFTGLAEFPDSTPTLQWIRETLRGESRFVMDMLDHLRDRLTRDLSNSALWRNMLVLSGGIFEGDKRYYLELRNHDVTTRKPMRKFEYSITEVTEPMFFVGGSGLNGISAEDIELIRRQATVRPRKWEDHLGLLAAVNRRTAKKIRSVSPWCQGAFLSNEGQGAQMMSFTRPGEPRRPLGMDAIYAGIDATEMMRRLAEKMWSTATGKDMGDPFTEEVGRSAVRGRP